MTQLKEGVAWTIDKEIVKIINEDAEKQNRSRSHIANEYLKRIVEVSL